MKLVLLLPVLLILGGCYTVHYPLAYCNDDVYVSSKVSDTQNEIQVSQNYHLEGDFSTPVILPFSLLIGYIPDDPDIRGLGQTATSFSVTYRNGSKYSYQFDFLAGIFAGFKGIDTGEYEEQIEYMYSYGINHQSGLSMHLIQQDTILTFGFLYAASWEIGGTYREYRDSLTDLVDFPNYGDDTYDAAPSGLSSSCSYYVEVLDNDYEKKFSPFIRPFISCSMYDSLLPLYMINEEDYSRLVYFNGMGVYWGLRKEDLTLYCRYELDPQGTDVSFGFIF